MKRSVFHLQLEDRHTSLLGLRQAQAGRQINLRGQIIVSLLVVEFFEVEHAINSGVFLGLGEIGAQFRIHVRQHEEHTIGQVVISDARQALHRH